MLSKYLRMLGWKFGNVFRARCATGRYTVLQRITTAAGSRARRWVRAVLKGSELMGKFMLYRVIHRLYNVIRRMYNALDNIIFQIRTIISVVPHIASSCLFPRTPGCKRAAHFVLWRWTSMFLASLASGFSLADLSVAAM